jgi:hypothetical protein
MGNMQEELDGLDNFVLALEMRRTGRVSYKEIGKALGISPQAAWKKVKKGLRLFQYQAVEQYRETELDRMDALLAILWPQVAAGKLGAIDRYIVISKHRAELTGAYMPKQLTINENRTIRFELFTMDQLDRFIAGDVRVLKELEAAGLIIDAQAKDVPQLPAEIPAEEVLVEVIDGSADRNSAGDSQGSERAQAEAIPGVPGEVQEQTGSLRAGVLQLESSLGSGNIGTDALPAGDPQQAI